MLELTVSAKVLTFIRAICDPEEIWRVLNDKYNTRTIADAMALRNKWTSLRMSEYVDVGTFMQAVTEMINELKHARVEIDNDTAVHKITELPQRFEIFVRTVQNKTRMPTLESLGACLHLEESNQKLRSETSTEEALVMRICNFVRQNQGRERVFQRGDGRGNYGAQHGSSSSNQPGGHGTHQELCRKNFRSELLCNKCGEPGHTSRYCLAPSSVVQLPKSSLGAYVEEFMPEPSDDALRVALEALAVEDESEWIIDSGASRYFLGNPQVFNSIEPKAGSTISAARHSHPIQGQGSINVAAPDGEIK